MADHHSYETVVGLEVHAQLLTASKLFCGDSTAFGAAPNTHVSPVTLGYPGTLPKMNKKAIAFAVKMGLACHSEIVRENYFARKNYFYPDLPKGYQVTQHSTPICKGGYVNIKIGEIEKHIRLNRIHLEEDAGKSIHDADENNTFIDYNRAGTPLIEIVSEPDLRSGEEAFSFLSEIRKLVRYLGICDGNMEEGSLRCDANISVRKKGETALGTKIEIKNLNSVRNVKRAIDAESKRLIEILERGESISQETRSFDAGSGGSFSIREKEDADDYRYFPEPDLPPFHLQEDFIDKVRLSLPALPGERIKRYTEELQLSFYDASVLAEEKDFSDYFEQLIATPTSPLSGEGPWVRPRPKAAANWMLGPVKSWLNENNTGISGFGLTPSRLAALIWLVEKGQLSFSAASGKVFQQLITDPSITAEEIATSQDLLQESGRSSIEPVIDKVLEKFADKVAEYKKGKKGLLALFIGEVMKETKGKADPVITHELLLEKLKT